MTQEDKDLLMKDLCGRLPYRVKCQCESRYGIYDVYTGTLTSISLYRVTFGGICKDITEIKPCLFPLSSITEEQMDKVEEVLMGYDLKIIFDFMTDGDIIFKKGNVSIKAFVELLQYFDKEMLDYRGLIKKGLAIDATGLNIY